MHSISFLLEWLAAPLRVGAIAPSSPQLAKAITAGISAEDAPVIELGPGSGVFTRALLERGIPQARLALIELSEAFAGQLTLQFPQARVLCIDAMQLEARTAIGGERAGAVVSGLPLLLMPAPAVATILEKAFECLRRDGAFYQFTYGPRSPVSRDVLDRLGLVAARVGMALSNFPPAFVYRIRRRTSSVRRQPAVRAGVAVAYAGDERDLGCAQPGLHPEPIPWIGAAIAASGLMFSVLSYALNRGRASP